MKSGNPIVQGDRLADRVYGLLVAAGLVSNDTEQMEGLDLLWIDREYFSVTALRFGKLARSMMLQSQS